MRAIFSHFLALLLPLVKEKVVCQKSTNLLRNCKDFSKVAIFFPPKLCSSISKDALFGFLWIFVGAKLLSGSYWFLCNQQSISCEGLK